MVGHTEQDALDATPPARARRIARVIALAILLFYVLDVIAQQRLALAPLLVRVAWALSVLLYVRARGEVGTRREAVVTALNGVCSGLCFLTLVHLDGQGSTSNFYMLPALPLIMALLQPQDLRPVVSTGFTCALGALVVLGVVEDDPRRALSVAGLVLMASFFGAYGASQFRKTQQALHEARWERARRETLEKQALGERQRAQTEKLATVGRLAADVMHEINNPLAFVHANVDFLREALSERMSAREREDLDEALAETQAGLRRIEGIVCDLKGFSRIHTEEPVECALADVVSDAARLAAVRLKHVASVRVEVPAQLRVFVTSGRLAQVVLNLLVNAGDALEQAGVREGRVWVRGALDDGRVTLHVEDNGPGIPPDVLPRIFEAFFTTKDVDKGTGLGLSIAREMVERFGGTLRAENRPEGGARLTLELPLPRGHECPAPVLR